MPLRVLLLVACVSAVGAHAQPTAQRVFDDLVAAIGDGRTAPLLQLVADEAASHQVVWYDTDRHAIRLDEQAYRALMDAPDSLDALAYVVGHELAHYYKDHDWLGEFSLTARDLSVGRQLASTSLSSKHRIAIETEADYFGGFFGHMAGYDALAAAPGALSRIYTSYQLEEQLPGYPPLAERQALLDRAADRLHGMIPVFDAGRYLLLIGENEEAARCFDFVARDFPSREILNNAGVSRALEAIKLFPEGELGFVYPLELDGRSRLAGGHKAQEYRFDDPTRERRGRLLAQAQRSFEEATRRDTAYATARLNLACALDLRSRHDEAEIHARRALRLADAAGDEPTAANTRILLGILQAHRAATAEAADLFAQAADGSPELSRLNLALLHGSGLPTVPRTSLAPVGENDRKMALEYEETLNNPDSRLTIPARDDDEQPLVIYVRQQASARHLVIDTGYRTISLRRAEGGQSSRGLRVGDGVQRLQSLYGVAHRLTATRQGTYHLFEEDGLLVRSRADTVRAWTAFAIQ